MMMIMIIIYLNYTVTSKSKIDSLFIPVAVARLAS